MKIYKTQEEVEKDIKNSILHIEGDVKFECSILIDASIIITDGNIYARNINAWNINARNINAWNIKARNIDAWNIKAWNINAENINADNINSWDIKARNINADNINADNINSWNINSWDIKAWNINAENISYYAFCCVYNSIKCLSIDARKEVHQKPICLDGNLEFKVEDIKVQEANS